MNLFGHDISFWIAIIGATAIRVFTSPFHSIFRAGTQVFISVFMAWMLTDSVVDWLRLDPGIYKVPAASIIALSADGFVRLFFEFQRHPQKIAELWRTFRGGGSGK